MICKQFILAWLIFYCTIGAFIEGFVTAWLEDRRKQK